MGSLVDSIMERIAGGAELDALERKTGGDRERTGAAAGAAVTALLGALARNAARPDGARALDAALAQDHDGSVLDDVAAHVESAKPATGDAILRHVLGPRRPAIEQGLEASTGLDRESVGRLLATLAPVVLAAVGKQKRRDGLDAAALASMLGGERQKLQARQPQAMSALDGLLDADGDGDVDLRDLARHGKGLFGNFLKGR